MRKIVIIYFTIALTTVPGALHSVTSPEELGREFIKGLKYRIYFKDMSNIFFNGKNFNEFIKLLKTNSALDKETKELIKNPKELSGARKEFNQKFKEFKEKWNKNIGTIINDNLKIKYFKVIPRNIKDRGFNYFKIDIIYYVIKGDRKALKKSEVVAVKVEGQLKIADLLILSI